MNLGFKNMLKRCGPIVCTAAVLSIPVTLAVTSALVAAAQAVANAKMHGIVTDPTGAIIPGATIVATQLESHTSATAISSDTGNYVLPNLPVGAYAITIKAPGFETYNRTGIVLQVSNDAEVNAPMTLGTTDTVINVEAGASQVQTEDNSITTIVDKDRVVDLPLNGRNAANLVLLSGGAAPTANGNITSSKTYGSSGGSAIGGSVNISISGGQGNQINYLLDGGDTTTRPTTPISPSPFPMHCRSFPCRLPAWLPSMAFIRAAR